MRRWSNDRFLSTPHGVINDSGTDRYSIAYFHSPNPDAVIESVPTCTGADKPPATRPLFITTLSSTSTERIIFIRRPPLRSCGARCRGGPIAQIKTGSRPLYNLPEALEYLLKIAAHIVHM
jgi:hypothetical protein